MTDLGLTQTGHQTGNGIKGRSDAIGFGAKDRDGHGGHCTSFFPVHPAFGVIRILSKARIVSAWATCVHVLDDDGIIVGLEHPQADADFISETKKARLDPVPEVLLIPIGHEGHALLEVKVKAGTRTAYVRAGNESVFSAPVGQDSIKMMAFARAMFGVSPVLRFTFSCMHSWNT